MATIGEIKYAADVLRYFAGWSDKDHGKTIPWGMLHAKSCASFFFV